MPQAKMDLIIPVYKNIPGLYRTLFSLGTETQKRVFVTIVDDASGSEYDEQYRHVIEFFQQFFPIRVVKLQQNGGPGVARQYGLEHTKNEYIQFIDCGDTFLTPTTIVRMLGVVDENPEVVLFSFAHLEEHSNGNMVRIDALHNRIHGKIYNREFLKSHNIKFNAEAPRANEDIGFNITCRMCAEDRYFVYEDEGDAAVVWKCTGPSITRGNKCAFYFKEQNMGLARNSGFAIDIARANSVDEKVIAEEIYTSFAHMFAHTLCTINQRPEFLKEAEDGALYYYHNYFKTVPFDENRLAQASYDVLNTFLSDSDTPIRMKLVDLNIVNWMQHLEQLEKERAILVGQE